MIELPDFAGVDLRVDPFIRENGVLTAKLFIQFYWILPNYVLRRVDGYYLRSDLYHPLKMEDRDQNEDF